MQSFKDEAEVSKPYIQHFMQNSIYVFNKLSTIWNSEAIKDIAETGKIDGIELWLILQFLEN